LVACVAAGGCTSPSAPPPPPSGGQEFVLDFQGFQHDVAPVLVQYGCDAMECHGGGIRGTYRLSPDASNVQFDFDQTSLQVNPYDREGSSILSRPLAGGAPHAYKPFASKDDPGYQAIRAWVLAGEFK
jgi:hypothetical protein